MPELLILHASNGKAKTRASRSHQAPPRGVIPPPPVAAGRGQTHVCALHPHGPQQTQPRVPHPQRSLTTTLQRHLVLFSVNPRQLQAPGEGAGGGGGGLGLRASSVGRTSQPATSCPLWGPWLATHCPRPQRRRVCDSYRLPVPGLPSAKAGVVTATPK